MIRCSEIFNFEISTSSQNYSSHLPSLALTNLALTAHMTELISS